MPSRRRQTNAVIRIRICGSLQGGRRTALTRPRNRRRRADERDRQCRLSVRRHSAGSDPRVPAARLHQEIREHRGDRTELRSHRRLPSSNIRMGTAARRQVAAYSTIRADRLRAAGASSRVSSRRTSSAGTVSANRRADTADSDIHQHAAAAAPSRRRQRLIRIQGTRNNESPPTPWTSSRTNTARTKLRIRAHHSVTDRP